MLAGLLPAVDRLKQTGHSENSTPFAGTSRSRFEGLRWAALSASRSLRPVAAGTDAPLSLCAVVSESQFTLFALRDRAGPHRHG